jgi:uncharacterized RDD family membrane protein YckC
MRLAAGGESRRKRLHDGVDRGIRTMSTMSEGDAAGQQGGTQHGTHPGAPQQGGVPSEEQYSGTSYGQVPAQSRGPQRGGERATPVPRAETRVTGRRVVQYLIDSFLVGLIPALVSIPFDRSNSTFIHVLGGIVTFVVFVVIGFVYWVFVPDRQNGQTLGMKLLGLRIISKSGGRANMAQLFIRWICLIFDAIPYTWPFTGLVGFIVILCSRDRQRIGDHLARTLVIATDGAARGRDPRYRGADTRYADNGPNQPRMEPRQESMEAQQPPPQPSQPGMEAGQSGMQPGQSGMEAGQPNTGREEG